jgi:hypothetical protein
LLAKRLGANKLQANGNAVVCQDRRRRAKSIHMKLEILGKGALVVTRGNPSRRAFAPQLLR